MLAVEPKTDGLAQTIHFLQAHPDESGIIYCATRKQVDFLAGELARRGWPVLPYHAGLDDATRRTNQRQFINDDVPIMVATIAFGMGINKPNVRFVLHYDLPKNLESYYQQIGRAGRDGLPSDCLLLFSYSDVQTINYFINEQIPASSRGAGAAGSDAGLCGDKCVPADGRCSPTSAKRTTRTTAKPATTAPPRRAIWSI
jgi:ATP-dependent DNA helicase RecQ